MKFLALISGGKDSFHNIHHCLSQGHELVALGNLYPEEVDELDSFMFQTVGHDIIENYSQCLDVPLYRQVIKGISKNQDLEYTKTDNDEIEDLYILIDDILTHHPEIEGISCGAILSHYQRTRIENICDRFNLTSLTFLWQRDQRELMQEMCDNELDARLIKVAAVGLEAKHLGKSITEVLPYLIKLNNMYQVHVCGEGGEFETIVLDSKFFKKRLNIVESLKISLSSDVWYLKFKVELVDKVFNYEPIKPPNLLEEDFITLNEGSGPEVEKLPQEQDLTEISYELLPLVTKIGNNLYISNLTHKSSSIKDQLINIFMKLEEILVDCNLNFNNIQHITLLLSDISKFSEINEIYKANFQNYFLPPSRITIETKLSSDIDIQLSCKVIIKETTNKKGIHIRSRSFWAPQNIGPYSQARVEEQLNINYATISGQIPLIPSTMKLTNDDTDVELSLQHFFRIKQLVNIEDISYIICFVTSEIDLEKVGKVWLNYCELKQYNNLEKLVIVEIASLPMYAKIEWGGETYRKIENFDDDDDDDENPHADHQELLKLKSIFPDMVVNNLKTFNQVLIFSNSSDDINSIFGVFNKDINIKLFCNFKDFKLINHAVEYLPTVRNFNYNLKEFKYFVILTFE